jgi:uncharacterized membrane-anchored protein YhcB (DUF1043 family)
MMTSKRNYLILTVMFSLFVFGNQIAFAQENALEGIYNPTGDALREFAVNVANSIPKIIAAAILLVIGLVTGKVVGRVVTKVARKALQKASQQNIGTSVLEEVSSKFDSVKLISATVRWFVYLFFIVAAVNAMQFEQLTTALTSLWFWVPNLLAFVLIIVIGSIVVNFVTKWVEHELLEHHINSPKFITAAIKVVIYGIVFAIGFTQLGVGQSIIPILVSAFSWSIAIAIGAAVAIGLGFALKDIVPASVVGATNQRYVLKVGQKVRIGDISGTVTASHLLHVIITNERNESFVIPTKELINKTIVIIN